MEIIVVQEEQLQVQLQLPQLITRVPMEEMEKCQPF